MSIELIALFALSIACDVGGQVAFKLGANTLPDLTKAGWHAFARVLLTDRWIAIGILVYLIEFVVWVRILALAPLGIAFPIASLNILAITLAGRIWLGEKTSRSQWFGAALITAGVIFVVGTI